MPTAQTTFMVSQILLAFANWLLLAVIARGFSVETTGVYNLILAVETPVFLFFSLQLKNLYLTKKELVGDELANYVVARGISFFAALLVCLSVAWSLDVVGPFFWGVFALKASELFFELPFMHEHKFGQLRRAALIHILKTALVYGLLSCLLWAKRDVVLAFGASSFLCLILGLGYLKNVFGKSSELSWHVEGAKIQALFGGAWSLGAAASILSFNVSLPRLFLDRMEGKDAVAIYSVSFAFYGVWQLLFNSYLNGLLPQFSNIRFKEKAFLPLGIFILFGVGFFFLDEHLYALLFGKAYRAAAVLTPALLVSVLFSFFSSYLFYELMAKGEYGSHLGFNFAALAINVLTLAPCIHIFGMPGAYVSWIGSLSVLCSLYGIKIRSARYA